MIARVELQVRARFEDRAALHDALLDGLQEAEVSDPDAAVAGPALTGVRFDGWEWHHDGRDPHLTVMVRAEVPSTWALREAALVVSEDLLPRWRVSVHLVREVRRRLVEGAWVAPVL